MTGRLRRNIDTMSDADVTKFSAAIRKAIAIGDNRGYTHFAGLHGWPANYCKHHEPLFLPWHRAYLYMFEMSLRDMAGDIALPWWDWTSEISHRDGVPTAYSKPDGGLASAPVPLDERMRELVRQQAPWALDFSAAIPATVRHPDPAQKLPKSADVAAILIAPTYADFCIRLEDIHDGIHNWFKGSMTTPVLAAFDPIFWAHHAMIDRLWYLWQMRHPGAAMPSDIAHSALEGFPLTVPQVLDIAVLGYDYATGVVS
jgi:tyrosinase